MRTITTLFFSIVLLTLTACEDKQNEKHFPETNNTEIVTKKDLKKNTSDINHSQYPDTFTIKNSQKKSYTFSILDKNLHSNSFLKKTIVLNISHVTSAESLDQMESLSKIQTRYQSNVIIISLLLGDIKNISAPNIFLNRHHIYHFVSFSDENEKIANKLYASLHIKNKAMPLTIIYKGGQYYSHFDGITPMEMINHDITQANKE